MVPYMPLEKWGFGKYGTTKSISVNKKYESMIQVIDAPEGTFEWLIKDDYNNNGMKDETLELLEYVADNRDELYIFDKTKEGFVKVEPFPDEGSTKLVLGS